jgi:hypothetical protein
MYIADPDSRGLRRVPIASERSGIVGSGRKPYLREGGVGAHIYTFSGRSTFDRPGTDALLDVIDDHRTGGGDPSPEE